jgi:CubicO group peptidase (beta-lactamase class C family)
MSSTTYHPSIASASGNFTQSWTGFGRRIPNWFDDAIVENLNAGPGGVISSARDMVEWMKLLLKGSDKSETDIPKEVLYEVMKPSALVPQGEKIEGMGVTTYGKGWMQTTYKGYQAS